MNDAFVRRLKFSKKKIILFYKWDRMIILFISLQKKDMMDTVKNRRTIRKYQQKDITPDLLNDLLETSFRASTMGGMQLYSVVVTRDAEKKKYFLRLILISRW